MKKNFTILSTAMLLVFSFAASGQRALITANGITNGWNQPSSWVSGLNERRIPRDNDSIVIPAGITMNLGSTNMEERHLTNVVIDVFGGLVLGRSTSSLKNNLYIHTTSHDKVPVIRLFTNATLTTDPVNTGEANIFVVVNNNPDSTQVKYTTNDTMGPNPAGQAFMGPITGPAYAYNTFSRMEQPRYFAYLPSVLLPVSISAFTATVNSNTVVLNWTSQQESNSKAFIIERSSDGNSNWQQIGSVQAAGQSSIASNYKFEDKTASAVNYYRLATVDLAGAATLSKTLLVRLKNTGANITLFPNPAVNNVSISVDNVSLVQQGFSLHISNEKGQLVAQQKIAKGTNIVSFDLTSYKAGIYTMNILFANGIQETHKLVVAK